MVSNHDKPLRKVAQQVAIQGLHQLSSDTLISTNPHDRGSPRLGHTHSKETP